MFARYVFVLCKIHSGSNTPLHAHAATLSRTHATERRRPPATALCARSDGSTRPGQPVGTRVLNTLPQSASLSVELLLCPLAACDARGVKHAPAAGQCA
eukprot:1549432-Pleurochrysis_carterae.AAC.2